ncbi:MAG: Pseudouridine synthase, Rsu [Tardiphaga sp.]|nr:Pseudouridine synthase, Rsu [Tardiphaga sp.]
MPRDNDKYNAPRGRSPGAKGPGGSKGRSGAARGPEKKFAKRDGKPFEGRSAGSRDGEQRPYAGKPAGDGPKTYGKKPYSGPGKPYAGKREGAAPARSFSDRPKRDFSERPSRDFNDRPKRDFSERPARGGDRPRDFGGDKRPYAPRPPRDGAPRGDRPQGDRPFKPREDRAPRSDRGDARPAGRFAGKTFGEKRPYTPRGDGDRPQGDRPFKPRGDRPQGDRPFKPRGDRPQGDRPYAARGERPSFNRDDRSPRRDYSGPDRSESKPWEKREPRSDRPAFARDDRAPRGFDKPRFDRPRSDRPDPERKPREDRGGDERPRFQRPRDDRPQFDRPRGDRPVRGRSDWQEHPRNESSGDERPRRDNEDDSKVFAKRPAFGGRGEYRERKPDERRPPRPPAPKKPGERIAKIVARAGLCSRRDAEDWITQGRVAVNGRVINSPALDITPRDVVTIDGKPLPAPERTRLFMFHKPRGLMTTHSDPEGRPTVFDNLPEGLPRLISIGRLDFNTEGLLLLTNDGGLARTLELPDTGWLRRYRVRAHGEVTQAQLDELRNGVEVDGIKYGSIDAQLERDKGANVWLVFAIREGKNREVRNVLAHLGLEVNRLIRVSYGPFQLGEIEEGQVEEVKTRVLREQLGEKIAAASGADFARQLPSKGDVSLDPVVPKKTPMKRSSVEDRKGRRVLVQRAGGDDARARNEDEANGYGPPKRPKRGYHGKRDLAPRED